MTSIIETAKSVLLEPANLTETNLMNVLGQVLGGTVDYADLYMQYGQYESWVLEDGIVKSGSFNIERGVGVRANALEKTGFAYADEVMLPALEQAARAAHSITQQGGAGRVKVCDQQIGHQLYPALDPISSLDTVGKMDLLNAIDQEARSIDPRVKQVNASIHATYEVVLIYNSEGKLTADVRPMVRVNVSVIAQDKEGRSEQGSSGGGGRGDYGAFFNDALVREHAREAVRLALLGFEATAAPAGTMPVVLGPGWPGVMLHEAVGHGLEADFTRKGLSAFSGRLGERVASPGVTIVDDGTLNGRRGSLNVDDEGVTTECTVLIEDGILKGYMHDKLSARLMNTKETGNGRRESYAHSPMPRMTNTYMLAGQHDPQDIIASVDNGLYAVNFSGGQVDITSGKFVFSASEAYLIENGKVTRPVKGATLIGSGPEAMNKVSLIGNDLALDKGVGVCGKEGQSVPVGVGQPTFKVDALTVGGTTS